MAETNLIERLRFQASSHAVEPEHTLMLEAADTLERMDAWGQKVINDQLRFLDDVFNATRANG
jgi:hypothetical protein